MEEKRITWCRVYEYRDNRRWKVTAALALWRFAADICILDKVWTG